MTVSRKIFMTADALGGLWTYALDMARGLCARGAQVTVAVLGPPPSPDRRAEAEEIEGLRLIHAAIAPDWLLPDDAALQRARIDLRRLVLAEAPDLIHLNHPALASAGLAAPVLGVCHSCLGTWWAQVIGGELPADLRWRSEALVQGYRACDALVAPSAAFAAQTAGLYGVRPIVVRNGRNGPFEDPTVREAGFVFTSGRLWDQGKGFADLDAATAGAGVQLVAAGPLQGPEGSHVLAAHALALGPLEASAIRGWLARAPVFASLARYEPFGLGVLEAAQAGCALVLSDIATFRELWADAARLVPVGDRAAAAAALRHLIDRPDEARRLGEAARMRSQRYTMEAMVEGTARAHAALLGAEAAA